MGNQIVENHAGLRQPQIAVLEDRHFTHHVGFAVFGRARLAAEEVDEARRPVGPAELQVGSDLEGVAGLGEAEAKFKALQRTAVDEVKHVSVDLDRHIERLTVHLTDMIEVGELFQGQVQVPASINVARPRDGEPTSPPPESDKKE